MNQKIKAKLAGIIESSSGVHLSLYLNSPRSGRDLQQKSSQILLDIEAQLLSELDPQSVRSFLSPIRDIVMDGRVRIEKGMSLGIFRKDNYLRVLRVPVNTKTFYSLADNFHVKPLLKWLQSDREFIVLAIENGILHVFSGNSQSFSRLLTLLIRSEADQESVIKDLSARGLIHPSHSQRVFIVASQNLHIPLLDQAKQNGIDASILGTQFSEGNIAEVFEAAVELSKFKSKVSFLNSLRELELGFKNRLATSNIFQIAKAAAAGKVKKLIIAEDVFIFGRFNRETGGLALHPMDLNLEDDCLLDDIAQAVHENGGEVVVARKKDLPKARPIVAIFEQRDEDLNAFSIRSGNAIIETQNPGGNVISLFGT
ncbi:MAG: hypothetical protein LW875_08990 [Proteobacteria bacterium]|jgi:hypothetical protein|nr:hypothetical protein [Pseudomonadota bacterium]